MRKKVIITAAIAACLTLCAVVWPQTEMLEDTPLPNGLPAVYAPKATVEELKTEVETVLSAEKEKAEILQPEQNQEAALEPRSAPDPAPVSGVSYVPTPGQATEPPTAQVAIEPPSGDMVYVEGFGWIESQGPNHVEYAEDMYENGNKIGVMG